MNMQPTGGQWVHPDQVLVALAPIGEEAIRVYEAGATLPSVLREAVLAAFLAGAGVKPQAALELVNQWRNAGVSRSLVRVQRSRPQPVTITPAPPTPQAQALAPQAGAPQPLSSRPDFEERIRQFMQDEATAAAFYRDMAEKTTVPAVRDYIKHAMEDEEKHYRMLGQLYKDLTGETYAVEPQPVSYATLAEGYKKAMDDEYEAMEEYREVFLAAGEGPVRNIFFELLTDELEHATRFNYALQVAER